MPEHALYHLQAPEPAFFHAGHQLLLDAMDEQLPFTPVNTEDACWCCAACGRTITRPVHVERAYWQHWKSVAARIEFTPLDAPKPCGSMSELRIYQRPSRRYRGFGEVDEEIVGPRSPEPWGEDYKLHRVRYGPCQSTSWEWDRADEARQQMCFLALLPLWHAMRQRHYQLAQSELFPPEWMRGELYATVTDARLAKLEDVVTELCRRVESAGGSLLGYS